MNTASTEKNTQIELKIQQGIRQAEDTLVTQIQNALDKKTEYGDLEESQFRNLVAVANSSDSAEVIKNFLRYQVGRDKKWGRGKASLAERIINDIDQTIKTEAEKIAKEAKAKDSKDIHLELIRRYLGYGARYLTYLRKGQ